MELALRPSSVHDVQPAHPVRLMLAVLPPGDQSREEAIGNVEGYVLHQGEPHELLATIHALARGVVLIPERIGRRVMLRVLPEDGHNAVSVSLSPRESEVLGGLVAGLSYKMVADKLGIGFETVRTHVKKIYQKLDVRNCTEAVAKALKSGLVS